MHIINVKFLPSDIVRYIGDSDPIDQLEKGEECRVQCLILHDTAVIDATIGGGIEVLYEIHRNYKDVEYERSIKCAPVFEKDLELIHPRENSSCTEDT